MGTVPLPEVLSQCAERLRDGSGSRLEAEVADRLDMVAEELRASPKRPVAGVWLSPEQAEALVAWAQSATTGYGPTFSGAFEVAREVDERALGAAAPAVEPVRVVQQLERLVEVQALAALAGAPRRVPPKVLQRLTAIAVEAGHSEACDVPEGKFEAATKDEVQEHLDETIWLVLDAYGGDRDCEGCRTVVRRLDRREKPRTVCSRHPGARGPTQSRGE